QISTQEGIGENLSPTSVTEAILAALPVPYKGDVKLSLFPKFRNAPNPHFDIIGPGFLSPESRFSGTENPPHFHNSTRTIERDSKTQLAILYPRHHHRK
ncbi:hypothetical protein FQN49_008370, partial [Arthroderma sp. PD_2]